TPCKMHNSSPKWRSLICRSAIRSPECRRRRSSRRSMPRRQRWSPAPRRSLESRSSASKSSADQFLQGIKAHDWAGSADPAVPSRYGFAVELPSWPCGERQEKARMNEDAFNASIRKFLKTLGVSAQREIEKAVRQALAEGKLKGNERLAAEATVTLGGVG